MKKKVIVGIDVSKSWLDAHILFTGDRVELPLRISNNESGFSKLIKWISKNTSLDRCEWLFCMEHTGTYSYSLNAYLQEKNIFQSMVNPLAIKRSMGIIRGKNDKADARVIAQYALRFQDDLKEFRLPTENLQRLKIQLSQRERMVDLKRQIDLSVESMQVLPQEFTKEVRAQNKKLVSQLQKNIIQMDAAIKSIIQSDSQLKDQAKMIESVPGIGPQTSAHILVTTQGMTQFSNSRKFASYCGVAPFEYSSGSSYRSKTKVHYLANHKMKSLLHMAALNASVHDPEIKLYYDRKKAEGKNPMSVLNAIRFKLIDRVFAVVKRNEQFDKNYMKKAA
ncbi:MAG: IS110 family transposase [Cytophagales bacterium]|nr:IS110 family transposase [Cytophagales bacterium]